MNRLFCSLTLLVVTSLTLAGCSTTSPSPAPSAVAACALVPNMDELVGKAAVGQPAGFNINDVDRCIWTYAVDPARSVGLSIAPVSAHAAAIEDLGEGKPLTDLGEDARWWSGNRLLSVALQQATLQVDLQLEDADATEDLALRIARAAVANMN